jgi:hypothetical protein
MTEPVVRLTPVVSWPRHVEPGRRYLVIVDVELDSPAETWPYDQEEYAIGCMIDGSPGFDIESIGETTLVVHRFGGTYGPAQFIAHAHGDPDTDWALSLTLVTAGGVPFRTLHLPVQGIPTDTSIADQQRALTAIAVTPKSRPSTPHRAEEQFVRNYRDQLISAHGFIVPPDFERRRKAPLEDLYVSPHFEHTINETSTRTVSLDELRTGSDRAVILGDPGSGKTTAAKAILLRTARETDGPLPFFVTLRNFAREGELKWSVLEYIEDDLNRYYQVPPPPGLIERYFVTGDALVMFDGLDELIDTSQRRHLTNIIEQFAARYPKIRILVTSRRIGYAEVPMDPLTFTLYHLSDFSEDNVGEYARKWFAYVEHSASENEAMSASFLAESAIVPDLRTNPLMLSLMCIIYRGQNFIPQNRPDIYEHCAMILFERWDLSRQIAVTLHLESLVDPIIKHLAYWMLTSENEGADGLPRAAVVREVTDYLNDTAYDEIDLASAAAIEFVDFCRGRGWVFTDVGSTADGEPLYMFTHRTFMEYFAACQLVGRCGSPEEVAQILLPKVTKGEWEVVAQLAMQIANKTNIDGADRVFATMLNSDRYERPESRAAILDFLAQCLTFVRVKPTLARQVTHESTLLRNADQS